MGEGQAKEAEQTSKITLADGSDTWRFNVLPDAISGSDMNHPGLLSMIQRAETDNGVGVVIAWERNRLARPKDPIDGMMLERRLLSAGKRVLYAATGQEADRSFVAGLIGYVEHHQNGDYLRKLSRDTMRGVINRAEQVYWPGDRVPFDYERLLLDGAGNAKRIIRENPDGSQVVLHPVTGQVLEVVTGDVRYQKQDSEICTLIPSDPQRVEAVQRMFAGYAEERRDIERDLGLASATMPTIPDAAELRRRAIAGLQGLDEVVASGSIEERKELIAGYLHSVVADPERQIVQINLYPTRLSQIMTGARVDSAKWLEVPDEAMSAMLRRIEFQYRAA
jgi:hypothetical protein